MENEEIKIEAQDRLELSVSTKGVLTFSLKIHMKLDSKEDADRLIERHDYIIKKLREKYSNLAWGDKNE